MLVMKAESNFADSSTELRPNRIWSTSMWDWRQSALNRFLTNSVFLCACWEHHSLPKLFAFFQCTFKCIFWGGMFHNSISQNVGQIHLVGHEWFRIETEQTWKKSAWVTHLRTNVVLWIFAFSDICPHFLMWSESESHVDSVIPWNSPGQNTGVGSLSLLEGIFPAQGLNPGLLYCRLILYQLSHKGSPS